MSKEDKLILGTLAGVDLILSPEHYEEYKGTLNKQLEEANNEIERLNNIINELENFINTYAIPEFNISKEPTRYFMETKIILDKLKELKGEDK